MNCPDDISSKLEVVLNSFLTGGNCKMSNAHVEMLVTHLSKTEHSSLIAETVVNWIERCLNTLIKDFNSVHHSVVSLFFKLFAIVAENEELLSILLEKNAFEKIATIVKINLKTFTPSIKLGHIRLLAAISKHRLGMMWIKDSKSWMYLITYCNRDHTLYVVREASNLIYDILYEFSTKTYDEKFCLEVIAVIWQPIHRNVYEDTSVLVNVDDSELQKDLCSTFDLMSVIFQKTLESNEITPIANFFEVHHKIVMNIWKMLKITHNEFFLGKILRAQTSYNFAILVYEKWKTNHIDPLDFNSFGVNFFNTMKFCIARRSCVNFLRLAKLNHYLWKKLGTRAPSEIIIENETIQFENQLIMFHLMPVLVIVKTSDQEGSVFDQYIMKLFSISSEFTVRICYSFRDILVDCPSLATHLAYKSIHVILSMKSILCKTQAVVLFQALVYALREFTIEPMKGATQTQEDLVQTIPQVLYASLVCLFTLVEGYHITWKESVETMCLLDIVLTILTNPNLTTLMIVQAIKLTQLSVEHFLSPNMALLVDNIKGSGLLKLAPIIIKNAHNLEWEVRDSTVELITSIVAISRLKFPAFQQFILDNDLCSLVYSIVKNDQEPYVRASGLKCLTQMISVSLLWEKNMQQLNLIEFLLNLVCNESEGIVRKEAITCITQMYVQRRIIASNYTSLYSTLAHCAVHDLYWEVKVAALNFWDKEIFLQFTNQGMIDGTFPTVTFSKANKKIVTLNETEIILRINKALTELSQIGCLDVILNCINDECDLEAVKVAVQLVKKLFNILEKYNYEKTSFTEQSQDASKNMENKANVSNSNENKSNESASNSQNYESIKSNVIDDIISTSDMQLLINSYKTQMTVTTDSSDQEAKQPNKCVVITPKEFISRVRNVDFDKLVENRNNWFHNSENLCSLLDDMILSGKIDSPFYPDCY